MFTLLHPAALLALTGLLVPVAIHLWNRRPGREVAVGSLRWLAAGANRRLRRLKPEQLWLLLLRAMLLAMLAVAVAGPVWRQQLPARRGVVLLSAGVQGNAALYSVRPTIDSLRRRGYALRWLAAGFPRVSGAQWRQLARPGTAVRPSAAEDEAGSWLWARVQQAGAAFPGQPLFVLTPARLPGFAGLHQPLPANVTWQLLPDTTTTSWLAAAQLVGDSLQLLVGMSSETQTRFRRKKILRPADGQPVRVAGLAPMRLHSQKLAPVSASDPAGAVRVEAAPLQIDMYASSAFAQDARYLAAGLRAAAAGLAMAPRMRMLKTRPTTLGPGWTFWLSDEPLPANWQRQVQRGAQLWREAASPGVPDTAQLAAPETAATAATVFRRGGAASPGSQPGLWADGRGRPILARQALGQGAVYQLHTRLSPTWSTLANDPTLPARLLALLQPAATDEAAAFFRPQHPGLEQRLSPHDHRALDPAQLAANGPGRAPGMPAELSAPAFRILDLRPWLVLAAGLLLAAERWLAQRRAAQALPSITS